MNFKRQTGIVDPKELKPITLIGAGGIGSLAALACAKMGVPEITVLDDDHVELHNLPNQFYPHSALGQKKVDALADVITAFSDTKCNPVFMRATEQTLFTGIVISGVDSMTARLAIWESIKKNKQHCPLYIEGRMLREVFIINTLQPSKMTEEDEKWYETQMCPDSEAVDGPCTERAVAYNTFAIGAKIALQVKKHAVGEPIERQIIEDMTNLVLMT